MKTVKEKGLNPNRFVVNPAPSAFFEGIRSIDFINFLVLIIIQLPGYGEPVHYALISVTDTGSGMDEATCKKSFAPFFTTKKVIRGKGRGLSIIYGIVKQQTHKEQGNHEKILGYRIDHPDQRGP